MKRPAPAPSFGLTARASLLSLVALAACSGGGGGGSGEARATGEFLVLKTDPVNGAVVFLNDPINIDFTTAIDIDSANLSTMTFQALDPQGNPVPELVSGGFNVATSPGDLQPGRRLQFVPRFASNNDYSDGGFRAGRRYLVQLVGGTSNNNTVLRDVNGRALGQPLSFEFQTREGTQPAQLFRNPKSGGPLRSGLEVTTASDLQNVPLGLFGAPPLEIRLHFDQALNPNDLNVPVSFDVDPLVRDITERGRIFLEYDDPDYGVGTWIPASVELERNDLTGATVALRPAGVLPNNATIRIIVESTLEDISGENNISNPIYNRVFGSIQTAQSYDQQWNGIAENFTSAANIDLGASFPEAQAEVGPGYVRAGFAFEGNSTSLEYEPTANEIVLNTAFTQIAPKAGLPFTVAGGVFNFRNVTIPQGVTVVGQGPNPMVWLCSGKFTVSGTLSVRGGDGARVNTLNSANIAKAGGIGVCGGGNGGDGTPSFAQRDLRGGTGRGPLQEPGRGGRGGYLACTAGCYTGTGYNSSGGGSGGGGGTMATQGDLNWRGTIPANIVPNTAPTANTAFQQALGFGGTGCSGGSGTRTGFLLGGEPGDRLFTDQRQDNDFWGSAIDVNRNLRITGELSAPVGGGGGGGGGDTSPSFNCTLTGNDPRNDNSGGGGGGGGGVLIVKALQEITVTSTGRIIADGGHGGGGEQVGSCGEAGGGGGGAGGMVILMSAKAIVIEAHGDPNVGPQGRFVYGAPTSTSTPTHPFLRDDYTFAISADGGVCTTGGFGSINVQGKYRANGQPMFNGTQYDGEPLGGLGGMGIVQLMVPPGENLLDGTNTRLDDNIIFRLPGSSTDLVGDAKRQLLAWRGFPNAQGIFVDDFNNPTNIGNNEGDIRPAPTLLPVPFNAKSRVRSKWIDTGASERRALTVADGLPRGILLANGAEQGPKFEFAGLDTSSAVPGYIDYEVIGQSVRVRYPVAVPAMVLDGVDTDATYLGAPAYRIRLQGANPALGEDDRYAQYEAEFLNAAGSVLAGFRILGHTQDAILVDPSTELLPIDATQVQVRAKFFKVVTNGSEGLGPTYSAAGGPAIPIANVRIGFAFHSNTSIDPNNILAGRYPSTSEQEFVRDLNDPGLINWINTNGPPRYVQWDVVFDMQHKPSAAEPPALNPSTPRPALEFLRLPFRF